jgi:hypothetical protein
MYLSYKYPATTSLDPVSHGLSRLHLDFVTLPGGLTAVIWPTRSAPPRWFHLTLRSDHYFGSSGGLHTGEQLLAALDALANVKPPCAEPQFSNRACAAKLFPDIEFKALTAAHWRTIREHHTAWIAEVYDPANQARQAAIKEIPKCLIQ